MWHPPLLTSAEPSLIDLFDELLRLTRGAGAMRLALADGLEQLLAMNGVAKLGYPNLDSYGRERLGRTGRWLGDLRMLNLRLTELPSLRAAYVLGLVAGSKVELLARHLLRTGDTAGEAQHRALALAGALDVRKLRQVLKVLRARGTDLGPTPMVQLTRSVSRLDAAMFEGAVRLLNALGASTRTDAVEAMLAEAMVTLLDLVPRASKVRADVLLRWSGAADGAGGSSSARDDDEPANVDVPSDPKWGPNPDAGLALGRFDPSCVSVDQIDQGLRTLAAELTHRDLRLGQLACDAEHLGLAKKVGCPDHDTFYTEVLGVAPSSMAARIALARRVTRLPQIERALTRGTLGFEAATLVARVASPATESEWLALADRSTVRQLRDAIDAAELHARLEGQPLDRLCVPTVEQLDDARAFESAALSAAFVPPSPMSGPEVHDLGVGPEVPSKALPDTEPDLGTVPLRLTLPEDLAALWRDLECLLGEHDPEADLVPFLTQTTLASWRGTAPKVAYHEVYLRDRYRCQHPACRSRSVTPHHIVFRSRGGSEDPSNLVALCERCHLDLVHGGHLTLTGTAPAGLRWVARGFELVT